MTKWLGAYHATVWNNADPQSNSRVQLKIPQVLGAAVSHWATPLALAQSPPTPGTKVIAMFAGGEPSHPLYIMETESGGVDLPVSIANGGTGATTASAALAALGGAPLASPTLTGAVTIDGTLNIPTNAGAHVGVDASGGIYAFNSSGAGARLAIDGSGNLEVEGVEGPGGSAMGTGALVLPTPLGLASGGTGNSYGTAQAAGTLGAPTTFNANGATSTGQWQQVCAVNINNQYEDNHNTLLVEGIATGSEPASYALFHFRVKQQSAMASAPYIELYVQSASVVTPANLVAIITANTSSLTTVELWFQATLAYESYDFFNLAQGSSGATVTFTGNGSSSAWVATGSLPAGTQQAAVYGPTIPIGLGGTGATTASAALTALGGAALAGAAFTGAVTAPSLIVGSGLAGNAFAVGGNSDFDGTVYIENTTAPATPGTSAALYASSGHLKYVGEDGSQYDTGTSYHVATGTSISSTTAANIAGITGISVAAGTYYVRGVIIGSQSGSGTPKVGFTGPATSSVAIATRYVEGTALYGSDVLTTLTTYNAATAIPSSTWEFYFEGTVTFSAAGSTFGMQAAEGTTALAFSVTAGSVLCVSPVV